MFMDSLWTTILSSAGIASLISAVALYIINMRVHKQKYKDDYYKMVIAKRMEAYAKVENVYKLLKTYTTEDYGKSAYGLIFNDTQTLYVFHKKLYDAISDNTWLSKELNEDLQYLNDMLIRFEQELNKSNVDIKELGKLKNPIFAEIRTFIDKHYTKDMLTLYDVKGFLKIKNK